MTSVVGRAQLLLPLRNRAAFLDAYFSKAQSDTGGLFVPGEIDVELGEEVDVELHFIEEHVRFHIRAHVKWKRTQAGRRALPPGVGIEFLPTELSIQERVLRFAEGKETVSHVQRDRRFSLQVDVRIQHRGQELTGVTDDISEGGCFVLTDVNLDVGTTVELRLRSAGSLFGWLTLPGHVTWRRHSAADVGRSGMGVEFRFASDRQRAKVKKIVHVLKERMLRDVRVKVPRMPSMPPTETEP